MVSGLCGEHAQVHWMNAAIAASQQSKAAQRVLDLAKTLMAGLRATLQDHPSPDAAALQPLIDCCDRCEAEAKRLLRELRLALRAGLQVFETYEQNTITLGSQELIAALQAIPDVLASYYARMVAGLPARTESRPINVAQSVTEPESV